jgi:gamma-butyrobetaine dioxygenase
MSRSVAPVGARTGGLTPGEPGCLSAARHPHEQAGAAFARDHLTERSAWAIEQHVAAKRYLVAVDPAYHDTLSPVSVRSLRVQGGPMTPEEAAAFKAHPWSADAVSLRLWDDAAKDPEGPVLAVDELLATYERVLRG